MDLVVSAKKDGNNKKGNRSIRSRRSDGSAVDKQASTQCVLRRTVNQVGTVEINNLKRLSRFCRFCIKLGLNFL